jgi:hypothetical protein
MNDPVVLLVTLRIDYPDDALLALDTTYLARDNSQHAHGDNIA